MFRNAVLLKPPEVGSVKGMHRRRTNRALNFTGRALISASTAETVSTVQPMPNYSVSAILFKRGGRPSGRQRQRR